MKKILFLLMMLVSLSAQSHPVSYNDLLLAAIKLDPHFSYEANVDSYMQRFRNDVWNRYRNDEFSLQDKRDETLKIMKDVIENFDIDKVYEINTDFSVGDYNFENNEFPLNAIGSTSYFSWREGYPSSQNFPGTFRVYFNNTEVFENIAMEREEARTFIDSRRSSGGHINRSVSATFSFKISEPRGGRGELNAEIVGYKIYDGTLNNRGRVIAEYPQ